MTELRYVFDPASMVPDATAIRSTQPFEIRISYPEGDRESRMIRTPEELAGLFPDLADATQEEFWAVYLDGKNRPIGTRMVSRGILNASLVHPREVFFPAIVLRADSVAFAHNHPSGDARPSNMDVDLTRLLVESGSILGINVLDHVIVCRPVSSDMRPVFSMHGEGYIPPRN